MKVHVKRELEAIPAVTLEGQVTQRLRDAIPEGPFPPGSQLNQVQIATQFDTSRGPVRLALHKLS